MASVPMLSVLRLQKRDIQQTHQHTCARTGAVNVSVKIPPTLAAALCWHACMIVQLLEHVFLNIMINPCSASQMRLVTEN